MRPDLALGAPIAPAAPAALEQAAERLALAAAAAAFALVPGRWAAAELLAALGLSS